MRPIGPECGDCGQSDCYECSDGAEPGQMKSPGKPCNHECIKFSTNGTDTCVSCGKVWKVY